MLRARRADEKEQRRRAFLNSVKSLFEAGSFSSVTMADVARQAGLAKGTVFLYFPTKEALFLELLEEELESWFNELDTMFGTDEKLTAEVVASRIADALMLRPALTRILMLVPGVLEHNIDPERVLRFQLSAFQRMAQAGAHLERHLVIPEGTGVHAFLRIYALIVGIRTLAEPGPIVARALQHSELSHFQVDFTREMRDMILAVFKSSLSAQPGKGLNPATPIRPVVRIDHGSSAHDAGTAAHN